MIYFKWKILSVSRVSENTFSPTQSENTPINNVNNSEKDQSQLPFDSVSPISDNVNAYELIKDDKKKLTSYVWNHFKKEKQLMERKKLCLIIATKLWRIEEMMELNI